jgi:hypothetical protein
VAVKGLDAECRVSEVKVQGERAQGRRQVCCKHQQQGGLHESNNRRFTSPASVSWMTGEFGAPWPGDQSRGLSSRVDDV